MHSLTKQLSSTGAGRTLYLQNISSNISRTVFASLSSRKETIFENMYVS